MEVKKCILTTNPGIYLTARNTLSYAKKLVRSYPGERIRFNLYISIVENGKQDYFCGLPYSNPMLNQINDTVVSIINSYHEDYPKAKFRISADWVDDRAIDPGV